jgi:glucokinase
MNTSTKAIGVDIGGSHISCAAFELTQKKYLDQTFAEQDIDNHAKAEVILEKWATTIGQSIGSTGTSTVSGIGFAMPGPFDYVHGIPLFTGENAKYEKLYGQKVPEFLRKQLQLPDTFPIRFINDATAFALGEDWVGKAAGASRSLSITLGTGFGSAFIRDGLPVVRGDEVPDLGCLWHVPFEGGIADDYFSTRGLVHRYRASTGKNVEGAKAVADAAQHDPAAGIIFDDFGQKLAEFLAPWLKTFGVEVLVIGGNISRAFELFHQGLYGKLGEEGLAVQVEISELKEKASIIGSARLAVPEFWRRVSPLLKYM